MRDRGEAADIGEDHRHFGLRGVVGVLVVASVVGALVGLGLIAAGKGSGKTALPFGTFLALAVILWLYAPASWLAWSPL